MSPTFHPWMIFLFLFSMESSFVYAIKYRTWAVSPKKKKKKSTEHELKSLEKKTVIKEEHNGKVKKFFFSRGQ